MGAETRIEAATLYGALVAAQAEMKAPAKDREVTVKMKTGGSYKFTYATMAAMVEAARPILTKHGLWFTQFIENGSMVTRIIHASGHMDCPIPMPNLPNAPQEAGSIITYFKRYSFAAAFGQVAEEEDDANIAEGQGYTPAKSGTINDDQWATLTQLMKAAGVTPDRVAKRFEVKDVAQLPADKFEEAKTALTEKIKKLETAQ